MVAVSWNFTACQTLIKFMVMYRTKTSEALLQALSVKMTQVQENYDKEKQAKEAFEKELEKIKKDSASAGSGKNRKLGSGGPHMMDYEMGDQHMFQSPEFMGEVERMSFGGGASKRYVILLSSISRYSLSLFVRDTAH